MTKENKNVMVRYGCFHHPDGRNKGDEVAVTVEKAVDLVTKKCARIIGGEGELAARAQLKGPEDALEESPAETAALRTGGLRKDNTGGKPRGKPNGNAAAVDAVDNIGAMANGDDKGDDGKGGDGD